MHKLYHYVHCPFCVRIRMVCGALKIPFKSIVLPYNDENTPISLMGTKMLPIMEFSNGKLSNESLKIIKALDKDNYFKSNDILNTPKFNEFEQLLNDLGKNIHSLAMPYWMYTPEFDNNSRDYFKNKKEAKRGPFNKLVQNKNLYLNNLQIDLDRLEDLINPYFNSSRYLTLNDILLASHLWGLYIVPEFQFSEKMNRYLKNIATICHFNYHEDFWRS